MQNLATLIAGYIIAFTADWRITLLVTACLPFLAIGGIFAAKLLVGWENDNGGAYAKANAIAADAFASVRVVAAYGLEGEVQRIFATFLKVRHGPRLRLLCSA